MKENTKILNSYEIGLKVNRLAWEIYEDNLTQKNIILIGISGRGEKLAEKIYDILIKISSINIQLGSIELNKDVLLNIQISVVPSNIQYTDEKVILDDVLNNRKNTYVCL